MATPRFSDSPNARSKSITIADGLDTFGVCFLQITRQLRQPHPVSRSSTSIRLETPLFKLACPRTRARAGTWKMHTLSLLTLPASEDKDSLPCLMVTRENMPPSGVANIFTRQVVQLHRECGCPHRTSLPQYLLDSLRTSSSTTIPDTLNETFHNVDRRISHLCEESDGKIHSGCTAVTAFLRIEDADGRQSFLTPPLATQSLAVARAGGTEDTKSSRSGSESPVSDSGEEPSGFPKASKKNKTKTGSPSGRFTRALKNLSAGGGSPPPSPGAPSSSTASANCTNTAGVVSPPPSVRRVLYTANAGDARGVLCRAGKAVRLTYDHKGSDKQEAKRITDAGGFVMSGRVNGVLAVTRSLGDSSMKEFVVGSPYTTETQLCDDDEFLILACDGVCTLDTFAYRNI